MRRGGGMVDTKALRAFVLMDVGVRVSLAVPNKIFNVIFELSYFLFCLFYPLFILQKEKSRLKLQFLIQQNQIRVDSPCNQFFIVSIAIFKFLLINYFYQNFSNKFLIFLHKDIFYFYITITSSLLKSEEVSLLKLFYSFFSCGKDNRKAQQ